MICFTMSYVLLLMFMISVSLISIGHAIQCYTCSTDPREFDHDYCRKFTGYNPYGTPPVFDCDDGACVKLDVLIKDEVYPRVYRFCDYHNDISRAVSLENASPFGNAAANALTVDSSGRRQALPPPPPRFGVDFCAYPIDSTVVRGPLARLTEALSQIKSPNLNYIPLGAPNVRGHPQPGVFGNAPPTYDPVIYNSGQRYKRQAYQESRAPAILLSPLLGDRVEGVRMCRCSTNYCNSASKTVSNAYINKFCLLAACVAMLRHRLFA